MADPKSAGPVVVSQVNEIRELDAAAAAAATDQAATSDKVVLKDVSDVIAWLGDTAPRDDA